MTCGATLNFRLNAKEKAKIRERNQGLPVAILGIIQPLFRQIANQTIGKLLI